MARMGHQERCISAIHWLETSGALALLGWVSLLAVIRTPAAQAQTYEVLFDLKGGADGSGPTGLIGDPEGDLYGTTYGGGIISLPCCPAGCGVYLGWTRPAKQCFTVSQEERTGPPLGA